MFPFFSRVDALKGNCRGTVDPAKIQRNAESNAYLERIRKFTINLSLTYRSWSWYFPVRKIPIPFVPAFGAAILNGVRLMTSSSNSRIEWFIAISVIVLDIVPCWHGISILGIRRRPGGGGAFFLGWFSRRRTPRRGGTVTFRTGDKGSSAFCGNERRGKSPCSFSGRVFISRCPWKTKIP